MEAQSGIRRTDRVLPFGVDRRLIAGILLVVFSVAAGLLIWRGATGTTPVLVAATDIPPGHVIQRADLRIAEACLDGSLAALAIPSSELDSVAGRTASTAIHAGAMIVRPDLGSGPVLGPDEVAITLPVASDSIYPRLRPTDEVALLATGAFDDQEEVTITLIERATVFAVGLERRANRSSSTGGPDDGATLTNITLAIPRSEAEAIAHALSNATITVVLLAPEAGRPLSSPP